MKELLVYRHAKAVDAAEAANDHERDLRPKGAKAAQAIGDILSDRRLLPDLILTSDATRAVRTAELCEQAFSTRVDVLALAALYDCEPRDYLELISRQPDVVTRLMVVGHNPTLEDLVAALTGTSLRLKTGAVARIQLPISSWKEILESAEGSLEEVIEA